MKVMISQPMEGKTNEQITKERQKVEKRLLDSGHKVLNTVIDNFVYGIGDDYAIRCLAKSIEFIADVDAVVFMKGWENARGCKIEYEVAKNYGKFIMLL